MFPFFNVIVVLDKGYILCIKKKEKSASVDLCLKFVVFLLLVKLTRSITDGLRHKEKKSNFMFSNLTHTKFLLQ